MIPTPTGPHTRLTAIVVVAMLLLAQSTAVCSGCGHPIPLLMALAGAPAGCCSSASNDGGGTGDAGSSACGSGGCCNGGTDETWGTEPPLLGTFDETAPPSSTCGSCHPAPPPVPAPVERPRHRHGRSHSPCCPPPSAPTPATPTPIPYGDAGHGDPGDSSDSPCGSCRCPKHIGIDNATASAVPALPGPTATGLLAVPALAATTDDGRTTRARPTRRAHGPPARGPSLSSLFCVWRP